MVLRKIIDFLKEIDEKLKDFDDLINIKYS